uniref:Uncharacterized protein n=1 Tax=Setaria viridis TaxID=4556 RepID=A0A4V6D3A1_SETVI|nr:hypothetical protein SEVIR_8G207300v2 [Setaria viridis]TKW01866.1 hypothetical protein SEVIR_8G207300v2 [Setaria viridis]
MDLPCTSLSVAATAPGRRGLDAGQPQPPAASSPRPGSGGRTTRALAGGGELGRPRPTASPPARLPAASSLARARRHARRRPIRTRARRQPRPAPPAAPVSTVPAANASPCDSSRGCVREAGRDAHGGARSHVERRVAALASLSDVFSPAFSNGPIAGANHTPILLVVTDQCSPSVNALTVFTSVHKVSNSKSCFSTVTGAIQVTYWLLFSVLLERTDDRKGAARQGSPVFRV